MAPKFDPNIELNPNPILLAVALGVFAWMNNKSAGSLNQHIAFGFPLPDAFPALLLLQSVKEVIGIVSRVA